MKRKKGALAILCLMLVGTNSISHAASLTDFKNLSNQSMLSEDALNAVNSGIEKIPPSVVDLYNQVGGTLSFVNGALENVADLRGLYWYATSNIEIRADKEIVTNPNFSFKSSLPHELGHFIYAKTYFALSSDSKAQLKASYEYWRQYSKACYSETETFATLYSWYKVDDRLLNDRERKLFEEAEKLCESVETKLIVSSILCKRSVISCPVNKFMQQLLPPRQFQLPVGLHTSA